MTAHERTAQVTVYHRNDRDRFMEASYGTPTYEVAYSYQTPEGSDLEWVWRANNRVDGSPIEILPETSRSLSVGDAVAFGGHFWTVANFGFNEINETSMTIVEKEEV